MDREAVESGIRSAFAGVTLSGGISALQSEAIEDYREHVTEAEYLALPQSETTDDWTAISHAELVHVLPMHLDFDGLRYYLPALMIWLLDNYDRSVADWRFDGGMTVIYTMSALAPYKDSRQWWWRKYDAFSGEQKSAIARYVRGLPHLVQLRPDDKVALEWWWRFVLRSRDPWVMRAASVAEMSFWEGLVRRLQVIERMDARMAGRGATPAELARIAEERARISQMSPPDDRWADFQRVAMTQLDLVVETHAHDRVASPSDISVEEYGWKELRAQARALRNDRASPETYEGLGGA